MAMTPVKEVDYGRLLNEARDAQHKIALGQGVAVVVDQNGERIEFSKGNQDKLGTYILFLEQKCGIRNPTGPMRIWM